ncbi:recombinase family protein [Paenochrobactrum gallinarii]|uniref:recombinase family protein n=1 Tax=Paenochrobactrum gallinarii TaxID=643673 RepID=UPI0035BC6E5A
MEIFKDSGVSGTRLRTRPGIQALLKRIERNDIDIVLCFSVDRISRDMEHSAGILKTLRFHDIDLWTVTGAAPIKDMEVGIRSLLSHEQIEDGRIKTREGMKHTIRKGKAAGGLAYSYRVKLEYVSKGEHIRGLREKEPQEAEIVRWIFEQSAPPLMVKALNWNYMAA